MNQTTAVGPAIYKLKEEIEAIYKPLVELDRNLKNGLTHGPASWATLEYVTEFIKHDLDKLVTAVMTASNLVDESIVDLEEEMELSAERGKELDRYESLSDDVILCPHCERPERYCICP